MSLDRISGRKASLHPAKEEHWIPLSDLMTGLMLMFLLVAIIFMVKVESDAKKAENVARVYDEMRIKLYEDLKREFASDLDRWGAELDEDLAIRFKEPDVLFDTGSDTIKPTFAGILKDFLPRYLAILTHDEYRNSISEVRIEGHTSSLWTGAASMDDAYFQNMQLSQSRTRSVLKFALTLPEAASYKNWLKTTLTANGLSSSKLMLKDDGTEDITRSRRVEFRVRTNAEERISEILAVSEK